MSTVKWEAFVRAVELGSLSKAAAELGYTQSGLSHMMKSLEDEIGFPLMTRTSSGIAPNSEGERLLPIIRQLLGTQESLHQSIAAIGGLETGHIRIAAFSSVAIGWMPEIVSLFHADHPQISLDIVEAGVDGVEEIIENRAADICFYTGKAERAFPWQPLCRDRLMVVLPPQHPRAGDVVFPIEALQYESFVAPLEGFDVDVHRVLDRLEQYPQIQFCSTGDYAIVAMVAAGLGVSLLPELILQNFPDRAIALPLCPPCSRILGVGAPSLRDLSPAAAEFLRYVRRYLATRYPPEALAFSSEESR